MAWAVADGHRRMRAEESLAALPNEDRTDDLFADLAAEAYDEPQAEAMLYARRKARAARLMGG